MLHTLWEYIRKQDKITSKNNGAKFNNTVLLKTKKNDTG